MGEQDILDAMFLTKDDPDTVVPDGATARQVLAERTRRQLHERTGGDYSSITDCEALDAIEYFVFPNFVPWAGYTTPLVYRFRPHGDDHRAAVMDVMLLEPVPAVGPASGRGADPPPRGRRAVGGRSRARIPGPHPRPGHRHPGPRPARPARRGSDPDVTLARYQESRIRHFHATLGEYLGD